MWNAIKSVKTCKVPPTLSVPVSVSCERACVCVFYLILPHNICTICSLLFEQQMELITVVWIQFSTPSRCRGEPRVRLSTLHISLTSLKHYLLSLIVTLSYRKADTTVIASNFHTPLRRAIDIMYSHTVRESSQHSSATTSTGWLATNQHHNTDVWSTSPYTGSEYYSKYSCVRYPPSPHIQSSFCINILQYASSHTSCSLLCEMSQDNTPKNILAIHFIYTVQ